MKSVADMESIAEGRHRIVETKRLFEVEKQRGKDIFVQDVKSSSPIPEWKQNLLYKRNKANYNNDNKWTQDGAVTSSSPPTQDHNSNEPVVYCASDQFALSEPLSPVSFGTNEEEGTERLIDENRLSTVHDNPFFKTYGKKILQRLDSDNEISPLKSEVKVNNVVINNHEITCSDVQDTVDVDIGEYRPGSGFVNKLKDKFASLTTREESNLRPKRSSSLENLLNEYRIPSHAGCHNVETHSAYNKTLSQQRAVSVENINSVGRSSSQSFLDDLKVKEKPKATSSFEQHGHITNESKPSSSFVSNETKKPTLHSSLSWEENKSDDELPKPNTVSSFRNIFEISKNEQTDIKPQKPPASPTELSETSKTKLHKSAEVNQENQVGKKICPLAVRSSAEKLEASSDKISTTSVYHSPSERSPEQLGSTGSRSKLKDPVLPESADAAKETAGGSKGLPSILMRKTPDANGEFGRVVLKKTKPRTIEDDLELKGRIKYYPAGLNKDKLSQSDVPLNTRGNNSLPKKRHAPLPPTSGSQLNAGSAAPKSARSDKDDLLVDNEKIIGHSKRNGTLEPLTPLDLSSITDQEQTDFQEGYIPTKIGPCKIQFVGACEKVGRNLLEKTKTKRLAVCFSDNATTIHNYPTEEILLQYYLDQHPEEHEDAIDQDKCGVSNHQVLQLGGFGDGSLETSDDMDESTDDSSHPNSSIKSGPVSSGGNLSNYRTKYHMDFEFGKSMESSGKIIVETHTEPDPKSIQLRPAEEIDLSSWSESSSTDLLF